MSSRVFQVHPKIQSAVCRTFADATSTESMFASATDSTTCVHSFSVIPDIGARNSFKDLQDLSIVWVPARGLTEVPWFRRIGGVNCFTWCVTCSTGMPNLLHSPHHARLPSAEPHVFSGTHGPRGKKRCPAENCETLLTPSGIYSTNRKNCSAIPIEDQTTKQTCETLLKPLRNPQSQRNPPFTVTHNIITYFITRMALPPHPPHVCMFVSL